MVFVIYIVLSFIFPAERKIPASLTEGAVYLLENFLLLPGLFRIEPMIVVAWSLSYELFYYLSIPIVIAFGRLRYRTSKQRMGVFALVAAGMAVCGATAGGYPRLIMFIAGIFLYEIEKSRLIRAPRDLFAFFALAGGLIIMVVPSAGREMLTLQLLALSMCFVASCYACFAHAGPLAQAFSWTPLRWLGNMSYSYYLIHVLTVKTFFLRLALWLPPTGSLVSVLWTLFVPIFAITLVPAAVLFLLVEKPYSLQSRRFERTPRIMHTVAS